MISLANLQANFAQSLIYQGAAENCDIHSDHFNAEQRMQIYRNNVIHSLSDVLSAVYPNTQAMVGEECFAQLARHHVLTMPSASGNVSHYGQGFDNTIRQFPNVLQKAPYLPELARLEAYFDELQNKVDSQQQAHCLPLSALSRLSEDQQPHIRLISNIGVASFESTVAVFDLMAAIQHAAFDGLNIQQTQTGFISIRPDGQRYCKTLDAVSYQLLLNIEALRPLSQIHESLLPNISALAEEGVIAGFLMPELTEAK
ncbi:HvfC/BufC N-terminal domain-containing protein [Vibrio ezurae]|uniref:Putative DNA-binding domain-containing protein n=1 Tax=Vibrio ezurae NBRC 102218 TaxID=1219080 RepID=U3B648_9VIBR|nr:DNA-binding domain-containing protein [Vibrio ezurae]GAD81415.1 hypothetical protein VEZ01S_60_00200 [Vibrio ezurae NBRC 102218]